MTTVTPCVGRITSRYGPRTPPRKPDGTYGTAFHRGVDIGGPAGTPVVAPQDGIVTTVSRTATRGLYVVITHGRYRTLHQHLASVAVTVGQGVAVGTRIGVMGTTGGVARHLHTEVHDGTTPIDPEPWYRARGVTLGVAVRVAGVTVEDDDMPYTPEQITQYAANGSVIALRGEQAPAELTAIFRVALAGLLKEAADRSTPTGRQVGDYLRTIVTTPAGQSATVDYAALARAVNDDAARRLAE